MITRNGTEKIGLKHEKFKNWNKKKIFYEEKTVRTESFLLKKSDSFDYKTES
jgi:hypothetical protein